MTGTQISKIREDLGLSVPQFAELLKVNVASAYRWETNPDREIRMNPIHELMIKQIEEELARRKDSKQREEWKAKIAKTLMFGGTLAALALLLQRYLPEEAD